MFQEKNTAEESVVYQELNCHCLKTNWHPCVLYIMQQISEKIIVFFSFAPLYSEGLMQQDPNILNVKIETAVLSLFLALVFRVFC